MQAPHTAIRLDRVTLRIGGQTILHGIDWCIAGGARAALLGPNGSGKTSLLRILTGYRYPTEGIVEILGQRIGQTCLDDLRRHIGLVDPTLEYLSGERMTAIEVVLSGFFGHLTIDFDEPTDQQVDQARSMLKDVGLGGMERRRFATLSTGEQRRTLLARAMASNPSLLILDEPTAGLDILARETLLATVDRLSRSRIDMTVLVVTHHLEELLPGTSNVLLLAKGQSVSIGAPQTVLTAERLAEAFGVNVDVTYHGGRWTWHVQPTVWKSLVDH